MASPRSACPLFSDKRVLILGAGVFGTSSALALARHAHPPRSITVIDRSATPGPAPDAASSDINKILRSSYSDSPMYSALAALALERWQESPLQAACHPVGLLVTHTDNGQKPDYVSGYDMGEAQSGYKLQRRLYDEGRLARPPRELPTAAAQRAILPEGGSSLPGAGDDCYGYIEPMAGWGNASKAMDLVVAEAQQVGVHYVSATVTAIDDGSGDMVGLETEQGERYEGDLLIVAAGSWTPSLLPELDTPQGLVPTGQTVACIQLTAAEAKLYATMPVIFDLTTEMYVFPPNEDSIVKMGIHGYGATHTNPSTGRSEPVTGHHHSASLVGACEAAKSAGEGNIPAEGAVVLRECLARVLPDLATRDFSSTRLCWYTESCDSHFLIDMHPTRSKLILATAGSGHGFKFLPILGDLLIQRLEGTLPDDQADAFSATRQRPIGHRADPGKRRRLETSVMATEKELRGPGSASWRRNVYS